MNNIEIEKMYKFSKFYKLLFTYTENGSGYKSIFISGDGLTFHRAEYENGSCFNYINGKLYKDFDEAIKDFESLVLLHR